MLIETLIILAVALAALSAFLSYQAWTAARSPSAPPEGLIERLALMQQATADHPRALREETSALRDEHARQAAELRGELTRLVQGFQQHLAERFDKLGETQTRSASALRQELTEGQKKAGEVVDGATKRFGDFQRERLDVMAAELKGLKEAAAADGAKSRQMMVEQLEQVRREGEARQEKMREILTVQLDTLRKENEAKLEQMRLTVDEKLQSTLDQRLDANFKQVSDRLESVQKGLGEMQTLANGVGDLKRVLTNVKSRGTWGEVQLEALLEDTLNPEQYARQIRIRPRGAETVDFAVRLPGHDDSGQVWLPIDCKFPHEDYARLLAAQEAADPAAVDAAGKALERAVAVQARSIAEKYICPPHSTDFAYLYVPTEGLFAEIVRREGFAAELRSKWKVEVAGPSTLTALLNSLRVGFRSLQIQKKSSEVWTELGKVKSAFEKYGDALEAVDRKLDEAKSKVADVSKKHQTVVRRLRDVESVEVDLIGAPPALAIAAALSDEDDEAA